MHLLHNRLRIKRRNEFAAPYSPPTRSTIGGLLMEKPQKLHVWLRSNAPIRASFGRQIRMFAVLYSNFDEWIKPLRRSFTCPAATGHPGSPATSSFSRRVPRSGSPH